MTKKTFQKPVPIKEEQWLITVLSQYVNTGAISSDDFDLFESKWESLADDKKIEIGNRVKGSYIYQVDTFLWQALGHSQEIMRNAIAALMIAGTGTYFATGDPIASICAGYAAGVAGGMLTLHAYKAKYMHDSNITYKEKEARLDSYVPQLG